GGLGCEALVVVLVARDDDIGAGIVQRLPQRLGGRGAAVLAARAEARVVPVGKSAARRVPGEVGTEPLLLRRAGRRGDVAVEGDDVPRPDGVAVVPLPGVARERAEVRVIRRRGGAVVLVIARRRARARLVTSPGAVVAARVIGRTPVGIRVVARGEHDAGQRVEQRGVVFTAGDNAYPDGSTSDYS